MSEKRKKIIAWLGVFIWMGLIFYLSHQSATKSSELSSGLLDFFIQSFSRLIPFVEVNTDVLHHLIRKSAHFIAYLILGVLVMNALRRSEIKLQKSIVITLVICVLYAISDETHQLFIPGRSGEVRDVFIDSSGAATGIGVYVVITSIVKNIASKLKS